MDKTIGILSNYPLSIPYSVSLQLISIYAHWDIYYYDIILFVLSFFIGKTNERTREQLFVSLVQGYQ